MSAQGRTARKHKLRTQKAGFRERIVDICLSTNLRKNKHNRKLAEKLYTFGHGGSSIESKLITE